ncbi:LppX_LprAFG lipoprotein [Cellulomonas sp. DKR-3]|uniref:LppX_LprAFG lipoprotein n=1 Tax=Cellulomonas fulva TaxID=2835530 RepID=A0ABS5TW21_9CELL|nr:LppX_LprAFG lipoprotein [Cellulomonas fulva]MBT0993306.1 LppX_LprAFG lipoprotein [Cellulomonas fulva]
MRVLTVVCLTTLAVTVLTGCGSGAGSAAPTSSIATPNASTTSSPTADPADEPTTEPTTASVQITADTIVDIVTSRMIEAGSVHFSMTNEMAGVELEGDMEYTGSTPNARLTVAGQNIRTLEMLMVDGVTYVNGGAMTQDKYVAYQEDDPENPFAGFGRDFDPSGTMTGLGDAISSVTARDETLTIDGALVRAYDVAIDTSLIEPDQLVAETRLPDSLVYTYWITDDGSLYRVEMEILGRRMTVSYSGWGQDIEIEAPASSEITDVSPF